MAVKVEGANVLVTGASSGIGAALARMLARRGATVGIVARRQDRLEEVLADCVSDAPGSRMWVADLGDLELAERVALEAWDGFGHLDAVVNNAAIPKRRAVTALTVAEIDHVMAVDFTSPVRMSMALLPRMLERDAGVIVNVSSMGGRVGILHEAAYCAAKFALCGWSEAMALDLWDTGVDVRLVLPGPIDTEIWDQPDNDAPLIDIEKVSPDVVAEAIIAAIEGDGFETYSPDLRSVVEFKTANIDVFLGGTVQAMKGAPSG